ncbi:MAG: amidohydrolase family protein, partial [Planctomycetes bacterium]|nr:amidohydrolase family protein [Planctomycetota bacterium]
ALTQLQMIQRLREQTQIPFAELVRMATIYPAQILNIADQKGSIMEGKDADIVICNQDLEPVRVFVEGQTV